MHLQALAPLPNSFSRLIDRVLFALILVTILHKSINTICFRLLMVTVGGQLHQERSCRTVPGFMISFWIRRDLFTIAPWSEELHGLLLPTARMKTNIFWHPAVPQMLLPWPHSSFSNSRSNRTLTPSSQPPSFSSWTAYSLSTFQSQTPLSQLYSPLLWNSMRLFSCLSRR